MTYLQRYINKCTSSLNKSLKIKCFLRYLCDVTEPESIQMLHEQIMQIMTPGAPKDLQHLVDTVSTGTDYRTIVFGRFMPESVELRQKKRKNEEVSNEDTIEVEQGTSYLSNFCFQNALYHFKQAKKYHSQNNFYPQKIEIYLAIEDFPSAYAISQKANNITGLFLTNFCLGHYDEASRLSEAFSDEIVEKEKSNLVTQFEAVHLILFANLISDTPAIASYMFNTTTERLSELELDHAKELLNVFETRNYSQLETVWKKFDEFFQFSLYARKMKEDIHYELLLKIVQTVTRPFSRVTFETLNKLTGITQNDLSALIREGIFRGKIFGKLNEKDKEYHGKPESLESRIVEDILTEAKVLKQGISVALWQKNEAGQ